MFASYYTHKISIFNYQLNLFDLKVMFVLFILSAYKIKTLLLNMCLDWLQMCQNCAMNAKKINMIYDKTWRIDVQ